MNTQRRTLVIPIGILTLVTLACTRAGRERHVLPDGFRGPVVIAFDVPGGTDISEDNSGTTVYRIPANGLLLVAPKPDAARAKSKRIQFYYAKSSGALVELLWQQRQVDGGHVRVTSLRGAVFGGPPPMPLMASLCYEVGSPSSGENWGRVSEDLQRKAYEQFLGRPLKPDEGKLGG